MTGGLTHGGEAMPGRRRARRMHLFKEILWRHHDNARFHRGVLVGVSDTGLAMITEHQHTPETGAQIAPGKKSRHPKWRRPARVIRVDQLSDMLDLIAAAYPDAGDTARRGGAKR